MSEEWRGLNDNQKKTYEDMAAKDKDRFEKEKKDYDEKEAPAKEGKTSVKKSTEKKEKAKVGSVDKKNEGKGSTKKETN